MQHEVRQQVRQMFIKGIRSRKEHGDVTNMLCPKMADWVNWGLRTLVLDGPKGKLP